MKRKKGLFKKAMELSILCGCEVALLVFSRKNELHQYSTRAVDDVRAGAVRPLPRPSTRCWMLT